MDSSEKLLNMLNSLQAIIGSNLPDAEINKLLRNGGNINMNDFLDEAVKQKVDADKEALGNFLALPLEERFKKLFIAWLSYQDVDSSIGNLLKSLEEDEKEERGFFEENERLKNIAENYCSQLSADTKYIDDFGD